MEWTEIRKIHTWLPESSVGWHQHQNGGGWVQDSAQVSRKARVGEAALVNDKAQIGDNAQIY